MCVIGSAVLILPLFDYITKLYDISDNLGKQCLVVPTSTKIINPAEAEFSFLLVRKFPKTSETNRNGLAAHLKNA